MKLKEVPVIGTIGPMPDGLDAPFWDGLAIGELRIQRCSTCGTWIWAPQWVCRMCHGFELEWVGVDAAGTVYSWTRTWQPFAPEFAGCLPYVTVLVELAHAGGIRLLGVLVGSEAGLGVGVAVRGIVQPPSSLTCGLPVLRWELAAMDTAPASI